MTDGTGFVYARDSNGDRIFQRTGSAYTFDNIIRNNGATYNLTAKTVTATIRSALAPDTVIDASLEDMVVTVGGTAGAAAGGVTFVVSSALSALIEGPGAAWQADSWIDYDVQYKVVTDAFIVSEVLRYGVVRAID